MSRHSRQSLIRLAVVVVVALLVVTMSELYSTFVGLADTIDNVRRT